MRAAQASSPVDRYPSIMKTRVIGLGNTILSDDGVGIYTAREVRRRLDQADRAACADVVETEVAGFALMELMEGWDRVILVDSIQFDDLPPGTLLRIEPQDLRTSLRIRSVHEIDLPTAVGLGQHLGLKMPDRMLIFGIQAEDARTFGSNLTPAAERGMHEAVELILDELAAA